MRGHVAPAVHAAQIRPEDFQLAVVTPDGRRLSRCLRCDVWIETVNPKGDSIDYPTVPALAELPKPRRGEPLREAILMRLISVNKGLHALAFTLVATALTMIELNLGPLKSFAERVLRGLNGPLSDTGQESSRSWISRELTRILDLRQGTLKILLALALLYAVIEWFEAIGLWLERRWAEYLTVIATAGFLPLEIHELTKRVTVLRVLALVVNVALVVWLVRNKRLFGVRGGAAAMHEALDWETVLATATPARVT